MNDDRGDALEALDALDLGQGWPRPGWAVLDAARVQSFTGLIEFQTTPVVRVHLDRGRMYLAERVSDPPLGARLVDAGALTATELEQGVVRLGSVEHLGRLFERAPTVDRHRVIVVLDLMTDEAARWVAAQQVRDVAVVPYEHHPSGVHRWTEGDLDGAVQHAVPSAAIVGNGSLPAPVPGTAHFVLPEPSDGDDLTDEVRIEWADAAWLGEQPLDRRAVRSLPLLAELAPDDVVPVAAPVDAASLGGAVLDDDVAVAFVAAAADEIVDGFEVIWPTGEVQSEFPVTRVEAGPPVEQVPLTWNIRMPLPTSEPAPDLVDELAEEVAAAVRRAIESITSGGVTHPVVQPEPVAPERPRIVRSSPLSDQEAVAVRRLAEPVIEPAPPMPAAASSSPVASSAGAPRLPDRPPVAAPAPEVVDDRKSALRRLINGLRRR
jgi:hypothetical protein